MTYQWDAADYEKHSSPQQQWARDVIKTLQLAGVRRMLDIGCGDGKVTAELTALVPKASVLGIDSSKTMIQFARDKFPPSRFPNLQFRIEDATALAYDGEFDLIVSFSSLHWVKDHIAVLRGIRRGLAPHGRTMLQFGGKGNAALITAVTHELITREPWNDYFEGFTHPWFFYSVEEYSEFIDRVGLSARRVELIPKDMVLDGKEGLKGWLRAVFLPFTERVPEALRGDFVDEIALTYVARCPPDNKGRVHVQMIRLEVEATL